MIVYLYDIFNQLTQKYFTFNFKFKLVLNSCWLLLQQNFKAMKLTNKQLKSPLKVRENQIIRQKSQKKSNGQNVQNSQILQRQHAGFNVQSFFNHYFYGSISQRIQNKCLNQYPQAQLTFQQNESFLIYNSPIKGQRRQNRQQSFKKSAGKPQMLKYSHLKQLKMQLKPYQNKSLTYPKSSKDIGFLKRYETISSDLIPFTLIPERQFIETHVFKQIIDEIYDVYEHFLINRYNWKHSSEKKALKNGKLNLHLQEFVIYKLLSVQFVYKNAQGKLKDILNFFYTLNFLKTSNRQIKIFADFLQDSQQQNIDQFFGFLVNRRFCCMQTKLRRTLQLSNSAQEQQYSTISLKTFNRILRILQANQSGGVKKEENQNSAMESSYHQFSFLNSSRRFQTVVNQKNINLYESFEIIKRSKIQVTCLKIECLKKFIKKFQRIDTSRKLKNCKMNNNKENLKQFEERHQIIVQIEKDTLDQIMQTTTEDLVDSLKNHFQQHTQYSIIDRILVNQALKKVLLIADKIFIEKGQSNQEIFERANRENLRQRFLEEAIQYLFITFVKLFSSTRAPVHQQQNANNQNWQQFSQLKRVYDAVVKLYNYDVLVVTKLIENILKSNFLKALSQKYCAFD